MVGRRWKYKPLVEALDDDVLYHVAKIVNDGDSGGLFDFSFEDRSKPVTEDEKALAKKRARSALSVIAKKLPAPEGEVEAFVPYRAYIPAWYGRTWKAVGKN